MPRHRHEKLDNEKREEWKMHSKQKKTGFVFALFLLVIGFLWLFKDLGYIPTLPFLPVAIILFALFLIANNMCCRENK